MSTPQRISHYELMEAIGRDGPTEIYRARDLRLQREVAVKLLRPEEQARPEALERFRREARISSLVSHPHICAVHDSGDEDGQAFLVCELLEGRALDEVLASGPMPLDRVLEIAVQIADALAAAHRRGIAHGNLKPSNVFITTDGHVKLLELGAAAAASGAHPHVTGDSGTTSINVRLAAQASTGEFFHPYLSPEQVGGRAGDARSDVFAAGALLYEMAAGARAFNGASHSVVAAAITGKHPPAARTVNPAVPPALDRIIDRAIAKEPEQRYASGAELLEDLRQARRTADQPEAPPAPRGIRRRVLAGSIAAALLAAAALAGIARSSWGSRAAAPVVRSAVLVGSIANGTADPDYDDTLEQAVTLYLAQSPSLNLVSEDRVRATLRMMNRDENAPMPHDVAVEVCQRLGLQAILEGSVSAVGRTTVIALAATDCAEGTTIARRQVEVERKEDVLNALGRITAEIRTSLGESRASLAKHNVPIADATTPSLDALKAYTQAVEKRAAGSEIEAIPLLEHALSIDPTFAAAHTTLSSIYGGFGETGRSEEYARRAYEHSARVSESERLFINYQYHDRVTGDQLKVREALEVWKMTYPADYRAPNALAVLLTRLGDYDGAALEATEAMRRNPLHAFPHSNLAQAHRGAGRYAEARKTAEDAIAKGLETVPMRRLLYQIAELEGNTEAAASHVQVAMMRRRSFDLTGARAQVAAFRGQLVQARTLFNDTIAEAERQGFSQIASGYAAQAALMEALYGFRADALEQARRVVRTATAHEPRLRAATALALAGSVDDADAAVRRFRGLRPEDTLLQYAYLPVAEAAVALARRRYDVAIEQLRRAAPYEHGSVAALAPAYLRAEARLRSGHAAEAIREYQAVLAHRGADLFSPFIPLAQLGLSRGLAAAGDAEGSRKALEVLQEMWKASDAGFMQAQLSR